jgi:hypothetical protein
MSYTALNLDPGENVILEVRKHWIVFVGNAISLVFSALLPFILLSLIKIFIPGLLNIGISVPGNFSALFLFFYTLWLLFLWISFFVNWTTYYLDVWYVTEKRIIAVEQRRIFDRGISNLRFDKIQDVTIDVRGFVPTLLNFGNIKVQTAGEDNYDFAMSTVRNPEKVRQIIFNQHNEIGDNRVRKGISAI